MALPFYNWSRTASSNATADSTVNWAEGQSPSSVNDSARAMMASTAAFRDDISGAIATGGSSIAYTVTSFQIFDTLAHMSGAMIAFTPHITNAATVTLNVDGLGAKPLRPSPGVELQAGVIIQGTPYTATYNNSDAVWYLQNLYGNPYNVPLGAGMDYWLPTSPNSSFVFPTGQPISRTTYSALFALMGTTFGTGDGSTTFNLPDKTGRVSAMKEATATRLTTAGGAVDGGTLGAVGGNQNITLITANLPAYTPAGTITNGTVTLSNSSILTTGNGLNIGAGTGVQVSTVTASQATSTFAGTAQGGTSTAVKTLPPMIVCNYILRII